MERKTIHIVVKDGFIDTAFADFDVDVVVYDLDCRDPEERTHIEEEIAKLKHRLNEVEVY